MHHTLRKAWALILALVLVLGYMPISAQAALLQGEDYITQQLSLGEDIVLHLRASLPEQYKDLAEDATGTLTYAGKTKTYTMDDLTPDENGMYDMSAEMAVAEMTDDIHAVIEAKVLGVNQEIINEHYSIRDYLTTIIDGDYSQTTKDLSLELLNMGAWAQLYFNHNISDLANAGYTTQPSNPVPDEIPSAVVDGKVEGIRFYGASVRFLSQTAVRFYFLADGALDGYTFSIDGVTYEPQENNGLWYIETPGINPQNMSELINVNVSDGTNSLSVGYAPIWYFIRVYHTSENDYEIGLMEAAYSYYKAAESYKTQICLDVEISTLSGNYESVALGFYPLDFEGDINNQVDLIEVPTGMTYTVTLDQGEYLVDGEFNGIGISVLSGPAWDSKLEDGSDDRHNIRISEMRLEGPEDRTIDLSFATITSGQADTGYTNAANGGIAAVTDGIITFSNGYFTDGYKITFNEVDTYLKLDMDISTLSGNYETIGIGFYPYDFEGDINDQVDKIEVPTGSTYTVKLDLSKYLVDGEFPGIGFTVLGGPAWDATLEDGSTPDRHNITISNIRMEGELNQSIDLSKASLKSGQDGTGYINANAGGTAAVADGIVSISNGFFTDGYKLLFVDETIPDVTEPESTEPESTEPESTEPEPTEPPVEEFDTTLSLDMQIDTLSGNWENDIEVRFYNYSFEGNPHNEYTDSVVFKAGQKQAVKLNAEKYLVDGQLTGIGIGIFGGPEWNTQISDGVYDRHTLTISNVMLDGEQTKSFDLSKSAIASGTTDTGYTEGNGSGTAVFGETIVISNGFCYDVHKISLVEDTNTYITMDMQIDTLGGNWTDDIDIRFYNYSFEGNPHNEYTDSVVFKAGQKQAVKLNAEKYLVDGQLTGIGIGIFGGPEWNTQISDGVYDRHTLTISNVMLDGEQTKSFDLSKSAIASGTTDTGYTDGNGNGTAVFGETIVISNGFCYDVHKISLVEDTNTYLTMDMLLTTLGGSTDPVNIRLFNYNYEGSVGDGYTDLVSVTAGTTTKIKVKVDNYLVDGELPGFGFAVFGGPEWNTQLPDGTYDRHSIVLSNVRLEGVQEKSFDLNSATIATGTNGTGYTWANSAGAVSVVDGELLITGGYCYDAHEITFTEAPDTYLCLDLAFTTLGNSTDPVELGFYPYNFEGSINDQTDKIAISAGKQTTVKLDLSKYLVDGQLTGIGLAVFGGPAWDAKLPDGYTPDRHTITISAVYLEGEQNTAYDLTQSVWVGGNSGGYTDANGSGAATIGQSIVITNGFQYDAHKISLVEDTSTYLCMDMEFTTLGNSTDPVNIRLFNYNYEGSVGDGYTDLVTVTAGTTTKIKVKVDNYLVDGDLPGFGFAVFGGPEWNTQLEDGSYDRHSIVLSNVRLEGVQEQTFNLNDATVANGTDGTGFTWANSGGAYSIVDGEIVITGGFMYDAYEVTF